MNNDNTTTTKTTITIIIHSNKICIIDEDFTHLFVKVYLIYLLLLQNDNKLLI